MQPTLVNRISKLEQIQASRPMTYAEMVQEKRRLVQEMMNGLTTRHGLTPEDARAELIAQGVAEDDF